MKPLPPVSWTRRASEDLQWCIEFVASYAYGRPEDRERDIEKAVWRIQLNPEGSPVQARRRKLGLDLRRRNAAQFVIVYAYAPPSALTPNGFVSIRAIRHASERNVFWGVRERQVPYYAR